MTQANLPSAPAGEKPALNEQPLADDRLDARLGVVYGVSAYLWWGFVPIYFKAVAAVPALEVLAHRVIWSVVLLNGLLLRHRQWLQTWRTVRQPAVAVPLLGSTALIAVNWLTFIYSVQTQRVLEASLGYFMNPLLNVLLGYLFLGERLRPWRKTSVFLAAAGVGYMTLSCGFVPWIALILALSFGFYGLVRKTAPVGSLAGLAAETALLMPPALAYVLAITLKGTGTFAGESWEMNVLLPLAGVVTAVPLLWFTHAARRLRLATVGFLQYIAPSVQFLLAVGLFGEEFTLHHVLTFSCIWTALAIYSADAVLAGHAMRNRKQGTTQGAR